MPYYLREMACGVNMCGDMYREVLQLRLIGQISVFYPGVPHPDFSQPVWRIPVQSLRMKLFRDVYDPPRSLQKQFCRRK